MMNPNVEETVYGYAKAYLRARLADLGHMPAEDGEPAESMRERLMAALWTETQANTPLGVLFQALSLNGFSRFCTVYALLAISDAGVADALSLLAGEAECGFVTPRMLCLLYEDALLYREVYGAFSAGSPLADFVFGTAPCADTARLVPDSRLLSYAFGQTVPPYGAMCRLRLHETMPKTDGDEAARLYRFLSRCAKKDVHGRISLYGEEGVGKKSLAGGCCFLAGRYPAMVIDLSCEGAWDMRMLLLREALLQGAVPMLSGLSALLADERKISLLAAYLDRIAALFPFSFVISEKKCLLPDGDAAVERYDCEKAPLTMEKAAAVWAEEAKGYPLADPDALRELAGEFALTPKTIKAAIAAADTEAALQGRETIGASDLKRACYTLLDSGLDEKAKRIPCVYGWEELVLPDHAKALLKTACDQVRHRYHVYHEWGFEKKIAYGRGVSMVFSGPPGTGKTMAAQVVAGELGLMLYRVDLASVVSKYVGETEKNLNVIFEKAKRSQVVLFFDEADVLFSKRTEVKDSNDKYNNMEAAFLLQKMEEYEGVTVLATNCIGNFDEAFKRRLRFLIDFPFPGVSERRAIWEKVFPSALPLGKLDMEYLAERFELSGSNIKNISLHAAFLAAAEGAPRLEMRHILPAVKNEYAKSGKVFAKEDAGEYYMLL